MTDLVTLVHGAILLTLGLVFRQQRSEAQALSRIREQMATTVAELQAARGEIERLRNRLNGPHAP
jgi:hypothetical protein